MADIHTRLKNPRERIYLGEILKEVGKLPTVEERVLMLRAYANRNNECLNLMRNFMQCTWHPKVDMDLPKPGSPEIENTWADYNLAPGTLTQAFAKVKYFVKGQGSYLENTIKRESVFIQILESLYKTESKLFVMVKDKKIDKRAFPNIDEDLFRAAFAGWLPPKVESSPLEDASR